MQEDCMMLGLKNFPVENHVDLIATETGTGSARSVVPDHGSAGE
jgi:hypothetical protein